MTQFDRQYKAGIMKIMNKGYDELNERTGHVCKVIPGLTFELDEGFPLLTLRKIPIKIFVAEQIWFIMGSKHPDDYVNKFTKIWQDFTEQDGTIPAAYGHRWRQAFGRDQLGLLVKHLTEKPGSRHGVVITWDPREDGLGNPQTKKNIPCPYTWTANIIGNKLHIHSIVRSNDMMLGCPHDVAGFYLLLCILAAKLGVQPGKLTHSISNAHIYDIHFKQAWELTERANDHPPINFHAQPDYFDRAETGDIELAKEITDKLQKQYKPLGPIKGMKIVL
ncbi:MAG TPA: thymidylate synthase [Patescibacteria group bacterium]|nr:thymidylate synthase [Patescibacteria group bacterium]